MGKELAATHAEIEAVDKIQRERYGDLNSLCDEVLSKDNGSEDQLHKYLQSQLESTLPASAYNAAESNTIMKPSSDVKAITSVSFSNQSDAPRIYTVTSEMPAQASAGHLNRLATPFYAGAIFPHSQPKKLSPDKRLDRAESDHYHTPVSPGEDLMYRLADLLTQRQNRDSLPCPEPEVFTGNPLRYPNWIKSFETLIERKTQNPSKRLYYLGKYTAGEAKEAISALLALDNTDAYNKARNILTDRFGNPFNVADAYQKKINGWPKIPPNDGQALRKFSDFLQRCNTAMNTIQFLNVFNDPDENQRMVKKLPSHVVLRWNRVVDEWLAEDDPEGCDFVVRSRRLVKTGYPLSQSSVSL